MTTILVVEDELDLRENIADMLTVNGYDVIQAEDGQIALQQLQSHQPSLVISDLMMPNMNGYDMLAEMRKIPGKDTIPFIFLTAITERAYFRQGMELGADDYLTKPFTYPELMAAVEARLNRQQKQAQHAAAEVDTLKKRLARVVTHELRSPISSIIMVQNLLSAQLDSLETNQIRELLETLQTGSYRMYHLAEQLSYLTQLDTGTLSPDVITRSGFTTSLWSVLVAAVNMARHFAYRQSNGDIQLEAHDSGDFIQCHQPSLIHAIAELLANALDFSPPGESIVVTQLHEDGYASIYIQDHGAGMTPEQIESAMRTFEQIDRDRLEQQGLGLGLPLAHRIVEAHNGLFEITSQIGAGTQIKVSFPLFTQ
ncbi:MAG: response regulator [Anaerolineae bacterium]